MSDKSKKYYMKYAGSRGKGVTVCLPIDPRKHVCQACGKSVLKGEIKTTSLHHWWYAYQPATVKDNPALALHNTSELCYYCHQLADAIRALLYAHPNRVADVAELLTGEQREKFIRVLLAIVEAMKINAKDVNPLAKKLFELATK